MSAFFRYPHTPHLTWLGSGALRDDKVLSPADAAALLAGEVVVDEKIDGANLGLSLGTGGELLVQNRGQYLVTPHVGQFARLPDWLALHGESIRRTLLEVDNADLILFGEWSAARHSLAYTRLPDWFLLFDVVDRRQGRFWSSGRRNALADRVGLATTPVVARGHFTLPGLVAMLAECTSRYRDGPPEGIVVRRESDRWCEQRAKLVRAGFTQSIADHWSRRRMEWNRMDPALLG